MEANRDQRARGGNKRPRGRPSVRLEKRDQLIQGATTLFNSRGIAAISIGEVAKELQLARASVYHYVKNRTDLVFQCYMKSCEQMADDLVEAAAASTGLERIKRFVSLAVAPDRSPVAVLSEINSLDESIADVVRRSHEHNIKTLRRFIRGGMGDGSIRQCDEQVAAQAVFGMLSWSQLLPQWSEKKQAASLRARTAQAITDLLSNGLAVDTAQAFGFDTPVSIFHSAPSDVFDRTQASRTKTERVLAVASYLFNRNGIDATSLDEIAVAMGVTKGVLYHYLENKGDLIVKCYQRAFSLQDQFIALSREEGGNGLEAALINAHLNIQAKASDLSPLMPQPGFGALPNDAQTRFRRIAGRQNKVVAGFLQQGIDDGLVRPCQTSLITHICAGAFGWIPKWREPDDPRTPIDVADEICDLIFRGIRAT